MPIEENRLNQTLLTTHIIYKPIFDLKNSKVLIVGTCNNEESTRPRSMYQFTLEGVLRDGINNSFFYAIGPFCQHQFEVNETNDL